MNKKGPSTVPWGTPDNVNVNLVVRFKAKKIFQERYRYCQRKDTLHLLPWKRSRVYENSGLGTN